MSNDDSKVQFDAEGADQTVLCDVLKEINEMAAKVPEKKLSIIWNNVRNTLATIEQEQSSLPSHEALDQAIAEQNTYTNDAEQKLEYAKKEYETSREIFRKWVQKQRAGKDEASVELIEEDKLKNMVKQYALLIQNKRNTCREKQQMIKESCA